MPTPTHSPVFEPPFVGPDRVALVDELVTAFDEVVRSQQPRWVAVEAVSGWGKTRLVQEFYRRLAAERQTSTDDGSVYWPASILDTVGQTTDLRGVNDRRKWNAPDAAAIGPPAESVPDWFWWGISCNSRSGTPTEALSRDLGQFRSHQDGLVRAMVDRLSPAERAAYELRRNRLRLGEVRDTAVGEGVSLAATALSAAVPGLGFGVLVARWTAQAIWRRAQDRMAGAEGSASSRDTLSLLDEAIEALRQVASKGLPLVLVVEDLFRADEGLVDVLTALLALAEAPVLVITTTWPGTMEDAHRPTACLLAGVSPNCTTRWREGDGRLGALAVDDRRRIAEAVLPDAGPEGLDALAERYTNPLALEITTELRRVRSAARHGALTQEFVAEQAADLARAYAETWAELPEPVQLLLMVAAIASPAAIHHDRGSGDDRWADDLLQAAAGNTPWLRDELDDMVAPLEQAASAYGWVRVVEEWLRRFQDPGQAEVARQAASDAGRGIGAAERGEFYRSLASAALDWQDCPHEQQRYLQRLLVTLADVGFVPWSNKRVLASTTDYCWALVREGHRAGFLEAAAVARAALRAQTTDEAARRDEQWLGLREAYAQALGGLGRAVEAIEVLELLLVDELQVLGPDDLRTFRTRNNLAIWLGAAGRAGEALTALEALLEDQSRVLGPGAPATLGTRSNIADWLGQVGRAKEAAVAYDALLKDQTRVFGPDAPDTLAMRNNFARWVGEAGRHAEALKALEALLEDQSRVLGSDAPDTFTTRSNLATWLEKAGRAEEAFEAFELLLRDRTRVLGPDAPETLRTRNNFAGCLARAGRMEEAAAAYEVLLRDQLRVLGPDAPDTLRTRSNLAGSIAEMGRVNEAIEAFQLLLDDRSRVLGPDAPDTLRTRGHLAGWIGTAGRVREAVEAYTALLEVQLRVLGPDDPATLMTRRNLAFFTIRDGRPLYSKQLLLRLLPDAERVLGPDSELAGTVRNWLREFDARRR